MNKIKEGPFVAAVGPWERQLASSLQQTCRWLFSCSKIGAVTFLTPFVADCAGLCQLCCMQHLTTVDPFPLNCFELTGYIFLAGSGQSGEVALGSGNLECTVFYTCLIVVLMAHFYLYFVWCISFQQPFLLVLVQL